MDEESFACKDGSIWSSVFSGDTSLDYVAESEAGEGPVTPSMTTVVRREADDGGRPRAVPARGGTASILSHLSRVRDDGTPTPGALGQRYCIRELTPDGAIRSYAYCSDPGTLGAPVARASSGDCQRVALQPDEKCFGLYDEPDMAAAVLRAVEYEDETAQQVYHVKAYDVVVEGGQFDLIIFLTRQVTGRLSGLTSLCTIRSSKSEREFDLMDYQIACVDRDTGAPVQTEKVNPCLKRLAARYGGVVPFEALHSYYGQPVILTEVILENTPRWFFAGKDAVASALDRMRELLRASRNRHPVTRELTSREPKIVHTKIDARVRSESHGFMLVSSSTPVSRRGLTYDAESASMSCVYGNPEEMPAYGSQAPLGPLQYLVVGEPEKVLYTTDLGLAAKNAFSYVAAYDAVMQGGTWDIIVLVLVLDRRHPASVESSWATRRLAYVQYQASASIAARRGDRVDVSVRDAALARLHDQYGGFVPVSRMAAGVIKPVIVREVLVGLPAFAAMPYVFINSFMSDMRVMANKYAGG